MAKRYEDTHIVRGFKYALLLILFKVVWFKNY